MRSVTVPSRPVECCFEDVVGMSDLCQVRSSLVLLFDSTQADQVGDERWREVRNYSSDGLEG